MKQILTTLARAALVAVVALPVLPVPSAAATAQLERTITKSYDTTFVKDYGPAIPLTGGRLKLTVTKDGYVNGYFTPPETAAFIPVVGGRNGSSLWFDIGTGRRWTHVAATFDGNRLVGYATEPNGARYRFTATPVRAA